jgi:hypothetical protein
MKLRFIGIDGSMGLRYGETYKVRVFSSGEYIVVEVHRGNGAYGCPYSSLVKLCENWEDV